MVYKLIIIFCVEIFIVCQLPIDSHSYINQKDFLIKNAVYIIRNREGNINFDNMFNKEFKNSKQNLKKNFELIMNKENENDNKNIFYLIKDKENDVLLSVNEEQNKLITINPDSDNINYALWNITPKINEENKLIYYVQNKETKLYWELENRYNIHKLKLSNKTEELSLEKENEFLFIELFQESKLINSELLKNEPIDVLIKYIDLNDITLNRSDIHQIKKDFDHCELKYCVRSILQNIPWIRKIFILMPNERVRFFKRKEEIEDKIIYVKDKDLLGFDSGNSRIFQYNLHKMKKFGLSENFIYMDDDYFIAKPINKNEMFYEDDDVIYPAIITSDYYEINKDILNQQINEFKRKKDGNNPHSANGFYSIQKQSLLFLYDLFGNDDIRFGKKLIEPAFSHNAIPMKISDIEEIHNYIDNNYEYGKMILNSKDRSMHDLQFQTLYWGYVKNKYNRKVSKIPSDFYDLMQVNKILLSKKKLFVINTSIRNYSPAVFEREKMILERLFPTKTKYELDGDEDNIVKIFPKIIDSILNSVVNEINNKINLNSGRYLSEIKIEKPKNHYEEYKYILIEELEFLKSQCFWQEITNLVLFSFFILMIVHRYFSKKN